MIYHMWLLCILERPPLFQGHFNTHRWRHLVVLHPHHNLILHRQLGCLPNSGENDNTDRECPRFGWAGRDRLWYAGGRQHYDFFQGKCHFIYTSFPSTVSHAEEFIALPAWRFQASANSIQGWPRKYLNGASESYRANGWKLEFIRFFMTVRFLRLRLYWCRWGEKYIRFNWEWDFLFESPTLKNTSWYEGFKGSITVSSSYFLSKPSFSDNRRKKFLKNHTFNIISHTYWL